jgi:hypothetical protein
MITKEQVYEALHNVTTDLSRIDPGRFWRRSGVMQFAAMIDRAGLWRGHDAADAKQKIMAIEGVSDATVDWSGAGVESEHDLKGWQRLWHRLIPINPSFPLFVHGRQTRVRRSFPIQQDETSPSQRPAQLSRSRISLSVIFFAPFLWPPPTRS